MTEAAARKRLAAELLKAEEARGQTQVAHEADVNWSTARAFTEGVQSRPSTMRRLWAWAAKYASDRGLRDYAAAMVPPGHLARTTSVRL